MKKFNLKDNYTNETTILDIWCQDNKIVAYVQGTYIYKIEMIIKDNKIHNYYCSCPSCEGGMSFCKHLSGVGNYLKNNKVLELESIQTQPEKINLNLKIDEISDKFENEINNLVDQYYDRINCYNSPKYAETISKYTKYTDNLLQKNKISDAFNLVIQMLDTASSVYVDCEDDYDDGMKKLNSYIEKFIKDYKYKDNIINYINENNNISTTCIKMIYILINNIEAKEDAINIINLIKNIKTHNYDTNNLIIEMLDLIYQYIGLEEALKEAYKHKNIYEVNAKIIEYIKETKDEKNLITELKNQIKESNDYTLYENLLNIYLKNNDAKAKNLLITMINKYSNIKYYKKLKTISTKEEIEEYRNQILNHANKNYQANFILEIYITDNMINDLFRKIKKYNDLRMLSKYKNEVNKEYHSELIDYYKKLIIIESSKCYGRDSYYELCQYIKDLYQLKCSSKYIMEMLEDMYPFYKTKKAFKEEISNVLNKEDKKKFESIINKLDGKV